MATRFWTFPSIWYQCQSMKLPKIKTTVRFIMHVATIFLKKLRRKFFKNIFCNLVSLSSIIVWRLLQKKRLGLVLFSRDGRVMTNICIFGGVVSNLVQRTQPSENKIWHRCFTIFSQLPSIIKPLNCSPILKKVFVSLHSSRILSTWIT